MLGKELNKSGRGKYPWKWGNLENGEEIKERREQIKKFKNKMEKNNYGMWYGKNIYE